MRTSQPGQSMEKNNQVAESGEAIGFKPLYAQVRERLMRRLVDGVWPPGMLLPSENKQQITLRVDADVLQFFRGTGKRYQSRMNAALREYVNAHRAGAGFINQ